MEKSLAFCKKYYFITLGTLLFAIGINLFLEPNHIASGGVSGIAIIVASFTPIPIGTLIFMFNLPLLVIGGWKLGIGAMVDTFYAIFMSSILTNIFQFFPPATTDTLLAAVAGSACVAIGIGIVLKEGATTGGSDIVVQLLKLKYPHLKTGFLFYIVDFTIVILSGFVFANIEVALYAAIAVVTMSFVMDFVLYGKDEAKLLYIISKNPEEIAQCFLEQLEVGITYLDGAGGYYKKPCKMIMCVMRKSSYPKAEELIKHIDPSAFLIVTSATEIYGEGYKNLFAKKL